MKHLTLSLPEIIMNASILTHLLLQVTSIFSSSNSEADASEFLKKCQEMFPVYHMNSDVFCMFKPSAISYTITTYLAIILNLCMQVIFMTMPIFIDICSD